MGRIECLKLGFCIFGFLHVHTNNFILLTVICTRLECPHRYDLIINTGGAGPMPVAIREALTDSLMLLASAWTRINESQELTQSQETEREPKDTTCPCFSQSASIIPQILFEVWTPNVSESHHQGETQMLDDSANRMMSNPNLFLVITFCSISVVTTVPLLFNLYFKIN